MVEGSIDMELLDIRNLLAVEFSKSYVMLSCSLSFMSFETLSGGSLTVLFSSSTDILNLKRAK